MAAAAEIPAECDSKRFVVFFEDVHRLREMIRHEGGAFTEGGWGGGRRQCEGRMLQEGENEASLCIALCCYWMKISSTL